MHGSGPSIYVKRERPQYAGLIMVQAEPECGGRNAQRKRNDQANQTFIQHSEKRTGREKPTGRVSNTIENRECCGRHTVPWAQQALPVKTRNLWYSIRGQAKRIGHEQPTECWLKCFRTG